jgi:hypothetical protein
VNAAVGPTTPEAEILPGRDRGRTLAGQDKTAGGPWRDRTKQAAAIAGQDKTCGGPGGTGQYRRTPW